MTGTPIRTALVFDDMALACNHYEAIMGERPVWIDSPWGRQPVTETLCWAWFVQAMHLRHITT